MDNSSMFQFHPELQVKKSSRSTTPRNLVCPEASAAAHGHDADEETGCSSSSTPITMAAAPMTPRQARSVRHAPSSRKYAVDATYSEQEADTGDTKSTAQQPAEQFGLPTGLPSARASERSLARSELATMTRVKGAPPPPRRSLRGSLQCVQHESLMLTRAIARTTRHLYRQLSLQQLLAYLLVLVGLLSESFTPAPRYNVPLGVVLFMAAASDAPAAALDHRVVVSGLCMATIMDLMWLLRPQEGAFNGYLRVQLENATHLSLAVCAAIKLWLVFATYFDLGQRDLDLDDSLALAPPPAVPGSRTSIQRLGLLLWSRGRFLLPRKTVPRRSHLSYEVLMRVLALIWLHGVCGLLLLLLGLIAVMGLSGRAVFRSAKLGMPLPLAMLFKSASTLLSYVLATHRMSYYGCLKVSGCDALAQYHEDNASDVVLKYNAKWVRRVKHAKVLDALLGVYLMAVLYSAVHSTSFIAGATVVAVLALTAMVMVVLDLWAPLLIMVVARCGSVLHDHHRNGTVDVDPYFPNQLEWEEDDHNEQRRVPRRVSKGGDSSSSSSSGLEDSVDGDSDESSLSDSGDSTDNSTTHRRPRLSRASRSQRRLDSKASSRSPLIPPLKRANSMLIVDGDDLADRDDVTNGFKPYWVRYWDNATGRSFLVHSSTNETVWEIGTAAAVPRPALSARAAGVTSARGGAGVATTPRSAFHSSSSALAKVSPRVPLATASSFPQTALSSTRRSPRQTLQSARASSHPTSASDIIVTTPDPPPPRGPLAPHSARRDSGPHSSACSSRSSTAALLSANDFMLLWDALPDGGSFTCRVSKVPSAQELTQHLHLQGFTVASDGLSLASLRTVHFYAIAASTAETEAAASLGRRLSAQRNAAVAFFLGQFVFDSLSLKLVAKFRCPQVDAIVPFVKKLQLKEIVGAYAPFE